MYCGVSNNPLQVELLHKDLDNANISFEHEISSLRSLIEESMSSWSGIFPVEILIKFC